MSEKKSDFEEGLTDMSQRVGAWVGAVVVGGKKAIQYIRGLTLVDTTLKPPAGQDPAPETKSSDTH